LHVPALGGPAAGDGQRAVELASRVFVAVSRAVSEEAADDRAEAMWAAIVASGVRRPSLSIMNPGGSSIGRSAAELDGLPMRGWMTGSRTLTGAAPVNRP
jgi:hypothetical protein